MLSSTAFRALRGSVACFLLLGGVSISSYASDTATATVTPTAYTFSSIEINSASNTTIVVTNPAKTALTGISVNITGDYTQTNSCGTTLNGCTTCTIQVQFKPTVSGTRTGTLSVSSNSATTPLVQTTLTGTGTVPLTASGTLSPTSKAFPATQVSTSSASVPFTFFNTGSATLTGLKVASSTDFTQTNTCGYSVAADGACTINVIFAPTAVGARNGTLSVSFRSAKTAVQTLTSTLTGTGNAQLSITSSSLPYPQAGAAYSQAVVVAGGTPPYTFSIQSGTLPTGLTINTGTGVISGTPTATGLFNFTVKVADSATGTVSTSAKSFTVVASSPTILVSPVTLPAGSVGTAYTQTATATGGTAPYTYTISSGALPAGMSLSTAGVLSGTPTAGGTFNFDIAARDTTTGSGAPYTGGRSYTLTIAAPAISLSPVTLPVAAYNTAYSQQLAAGGSVAPYTYSIVSGSLPAGITLSGAGLLSGTTTATAQTYNFTVRVTDSATNTAAGNAHYTADFPMTITVNPQPPVAGAVSLSVLYGSANNNVPVALSGGTPTSLAIASAAAHGTATVSGNTITYTPAAGYSGADAFTYTATNAGGISQAATVTVQVNKVPVTVTLGSLSQVYSGSARSATATTAKTSDGSAVTVAGITYTYNGNTAAPVNYSASGYAVVATVNDPGYTGTATGTLFVTQAPLTVTAANATKAYGAAFPALTGTYSGQVNGESFTVTGTTTATANSPVVAGGYPITPAVTGATIANYSVTPVNGTLTVTAAQLTITAPTLSKAYGAAVPSLAGTYAGQVNGDTFAVIGSTAATSTSPIVAGGYAITPSVTGANLANYSVIPVNGTLTITPATLTITASAASKVYGAALPALTGTYTGQVNGDTFTVTGTTTATAASGVVAGGYAITPAATGSNLANYTVRPVNGTLTVTPAPLTLTAASASKAYGAAVPALTGTQSGAVNGDAFAVTGSTAATAASPVVAGGYPVTPTATGASLANYTVTNANGTLTVTAVPLAATAASVSKAYGASVPALSGTYSGQVNGDAFTVTATTTATSSSPVVAGGYPITPAITGPNIGSYTVTPVNGTLTVTQGQLTITAPTLTKAYGTAMPSLAGTYSGNAPNDTFTVTGASTATAASAPGSYTITPSVTGPALSNYAVTPVNGSITVIKAATAASLTASAAQTIPGATVTLTATVASSTTGTPTGSVNFYDGAALLNTTPIALVAGSASATIAPTASGAHIFTVAYLGDTNYAASASTASAGATTTVVPMDFTLAPTTGGTTTVNGTKGGTAVFSFNIAPGAGGFPAAVTFAASGGPAGATYTFSPSSFPASNAGGAVTLTVGIPTTLSQNAVPKPGNHYVPIALGVLMLPFAAARRMRKRFGALMMMALLGVIAAGASGCGSSPSGTTAPGTSTHTYAITVTATSGSVQHSMVMTLNVQ